MRPLRASLELNSSTPAGVMSVHVLHTGNGALVNSTLTGVMVLSSHVIDVVSGSGGGGSSSSR